MKLRTKKGAILCAAAAAGLTAGLIWANSALMTQEYILSSPMLPAAFSGYRIAQVSDLHNTEFGQDNSRLLERLADAKPDLIVVTGDLLDSRRTDLDAALRFGQAAVAVAPVCYVPGNHEGRIPEIYAQLKQGLEEAGVTVLEDERTTLVREDAQIALIGLRDVLNETEAGIQARLAGLVSPEDEFQILLAHRPELFPAYADCGLDLIFSGHAHGGQVRLPIVGGLIAPNQGLFPTYQAGLYQDGESTMVVSRGLGNSLCPLRVNNRPELVVVELRALP